MDLNNTENISLEALDIKLDPADVFIKHETAEDVSTIEGRINEEADEMFDVARQVESLPPPGYGVDIKEERKCDFNTKFDFMYSEENMHGQDYQPVAGPSSAEYSVEAPELNTRDDARKSLRRSTRRRGQVGRTASNSSSNGTLADDGADEEAASLQTKNRKTGTRANTKTCRACEDAFQTQNAMEEHFRKCHRSLKPYACHTCGKTYRTYSAFGGHKNSHCLKRVYECPICNKAFGKNEVLKGHLQTHEENRPRPHECLLCGKTFAVVYELRRHHQTHTDERSYRCDICGKGFVQKGDLGYHYRTHTNDKPYMCEICHRRFARKHVLKNHVLTHTREKPYKCEQCDQTFARKDVLMNHQKTHKEKYEYGCDVCLTDFATKALLTYHVMRGRCESNNLEDTPMLAND